MIKKIWNKKDILILLIVPIELSLFYIINRIFNTYDYNILNLILKSVVISLGFIITVMMKKDLLKKQFKEYNEDLGLNLLSSIISAIIIAGIFFLINSYFTKGNSSYDSLGFVDSFDKHKIPYLLFLSFIGLVSPIKEEIIFRHELFYKFKFSKLLMSIMFVVSSILFGLIYTIKFGFEYYLILPVIISGMYMAILYYFSENIWKPIMAHLFNNFLFFVAPRLFLIIIYIVS